MLMNNKSWKLDIISTDKLKEILDSCIGTITKIVNISLTTGQFCDQWKTAIVKLLLKKLGLEFTNRNYRPVSNLCSILKTGGKCMLDQLLDHCNNNNLLPDFQSTYCQYHSTETSLINYHQWHLMGYGKPGGNNDAHFILKCSLWYCGPLHPAQNPSQIIWLLWSSTQIVWHVSATKVVQSLHWWQLLKTNGVTVQHTPGLMLQGQSNLLLLFTNIIMYTTSTKYWWLCWWPFDKAMTQNNKWNQLTGKYYNANNTHINQGLDGLHAFKPQYQQNKIHNFLAQNIK